MEEVSYFINFQMSKFAKYKYSGMLLSHRKDEALPFETSWVGVLQNIIPSEISQTKHTLLN